MGSETIKLGLMELSAIRELSNIGAGHATTALAELTGEPLGMSVPEAEQVAFEEIPALLGNPEDLAVGIYMPIDGEIGGHMGFLLPWTAAHKLWKCLLGQAPQSVEEVSDLEASAMLEVGNIIISSYLNAISDMTGTAMHSTPAAMSVEMGCAILEAIVSEACAADQVALYIRTRLYDEDGDIDGFFVYFPTVGGLRQLFARLGIAEAA